MPPSVVVVKIGGSLFQLEGLSARIHQFREQYANHSLVLIPGGGKVADFVRQIDQVQNLGEDVSHWTAILAMTFHCYWLQHVICDFELVDYPRLLAKISSKKSNCILDPYSFCVIDDSHADSLPQSWQVTSDSIAARLAVAIEASELVLLKSISIPEKMSWEEASEKGFVDSYFPNVIKQAKSALRIRVCNLRYGASE